MPRPSAPKLHAVEREQPTLEEQIRALLIDLDRAEEQALLIRARLEPLRRECRDAQPGTFVLPTIDQLRKFAS